MVDKNFQKIIRSYITHEMEIIFHEFFLNRAKENKLGENVHFIVYQVNDATPFEYNTELIPVAMRVMTYYPNPNISDEIIAKTKSLIHSLETGF